MGRFVALAVALTLGLASTLAYSGSSSAQSDRSILRACAPSEGKIEARGLPPVVDAGDCPVGDRVISDNGASSTLPPRGESVHVETLGVSGAQELVIEHRPDGAIELAKVGDDSAANEPARATRATGPSECSDRAFTPLSYRVEPGLSYYFNRATTPSEITRTAAEAAVRRATTNVANTRNACRLGDRVSVGMAYAGATTAVAGVSASGTCAANDGKSIVSFGTLSSGALAVTCTNYLVGGGGPDRVTASDIRINTGPRWTTAPTARSCKNSYDLESVLTHERGHTFGLSHVSEGSHGNLTMSTRSNGPCQASERTLGRGDVLGLDAKY
ncbi:matrixin family metalloprotease [Rubrobacter marinus]|uniref:Matrixin family metalloprotease n=1 Tax=Rubrobacter marinus TaxID=2653852 RepID=A0A6G8PXV6_9ACTN|nr:matrixin family metalloprotease [Rubrobacter marinus]QIN79020.1 matrixin family metalloprotease [Rubrobacter marinus]